MVKVTIEQQAKDLSFESIYSEMNKLKIEKIVIQRDITQLVEKRDNLVSKIGHLNQIALTKRRQLINAKTGI